MDVITGLLGNIDFNAIMTAVTDFLAKINLQEVLAKIMEFISGIIAA